MITTPAPGSRRHADRPRPDLTAAAELLPTLLNSYLLNSPFSFQAMEKHAAYCAMLRLGLKIPETVLVPYKNPLDNARYAYTSARYNKSFDLNEVAAQIGYPMYMKPFDGGGWRGVSRGSPGSTMPRTCAAPTTLLAGCSCTCRLPSKTTTCSPGPCRSARRRW
jgi:hypothetical protein